MRRALLIVIVVVLFVVLTVLFVATSPLTEHFWDFYFFPDGEPWWRGAVWGNVIAIWPSAPVIVVFGVAGYFFHKRAMTPLHEKIDILDKAHADRHDEHMRAMKSILDALDPETESDSVLDTIADRVDDQTETGIGVIIKRLDEKGTK